jgi:hypothetical protein
MQLVSRQEVQPVHARLLVRPQLRIDGHRQWIFLQCGTVKKLFKEATLAEGSDRVYKQNEYIHTLNSIPLLLRNKACSEAWGIGKTLLKRHDTQ